MKPVSFPSTTHPTQPARLGSPIDAHALEASIDEPGPIAVDTVGMDWEANLAGLLNLKHPTTVAAGVRNRKEQIKIYIHVLRHPTHGFFLIDTGVSRRFVEQPAAVGVGGMLRRYGGIENMATEPNTEQVIAAQDVPLAGVFMTHLHLDHVSGLPDIPLDTPIYTGPGEAEAALFLNLFAQGTNNRLLAGRPPLQELTFTSDPGARFDGIIDIFGDRSLFAISTPGHTAGHVSYLARTPGGAVLFTGDTCHTRWGWDNDVEPGTYLADRAASRESLRQLKALSSRHPHMAVRLGHQA